MEQIIALRRGEVEGVRNLLLFHWCTWTFTLSGMNGEPLEKAAQALNRRFKEPLPDWEVRSVCKSSTTEFVNRATGEVRARRFRTTNVILTLAVTPNEQRRMVVLIGADEKRRRDRIRAEKKRRERGVVSHADEAQELLQRVRAAVTNRPDSTTSELARALNISVPTARKYRRQLLLEQTNENL